MTDSLDYTQHEELTALFVADVLENVDPDNYNIEEERYHPYWSKRFAEIALEWHTRQLQELREAVAEFDRLRSSYHGAPALPDRDIDEEVGDLVAIRIQQDIALEAARRLVTTEDQ